ncbi:hypothetical protein NA78x_000120 [Anatilimnocola sp. NA78]|uniref:hypothetical protein n=1 Tax=Anatilimnocola sp. NA78 TaxID=3415683 RepID=UPI003CE48205
MRLALLGSDDELKALLRELPEGSGHTLVAAYEADENRLPLAAFMPAVERSENWESLLVRDDIDLVLVGNPRELRMGGDSLEPQGRRVDQLRKLAQAGRNLLVSHPAVDLLDGYEIEMLRREGGGGIVPWFPGMTHFVTDDWIEQLQLDRVEQVEWKRAVATRNKQSVTAVLARDLLLMERLLGKLKRVTALGGTATTEPSQQAWHALTVQVESGSGVVVRWSMMPPAEFALQVNFTGVTGAEQRLEVRSEPTLPWRITGGVSDSGEWRASNEAVATLSAVEEVLQDSVLLGSAWLEACRNLETLAAVEKSLQKGRTIELSQAEQTEEHNFKGVMASGGCLLLLLILLTIFVVSLVEGLQLPLRNWFLWRMWPLALFVPLVIFLAMQFLQTIIQKPGSKPAPKSEAPPR